MFGTVKPLNSWNRFLQWTPPGSFFHEFPGPKNTEKSRPWVFFTKFRGLLKMVKKHHTQGHRVFFTNFPGKTCISHSKMHDFHDKNSHSVFFTKIPGHLSMRKSPSSFFHEFSGESFHEFRSKFFRIFEKCSALGSANTLPAVPKLWNWLASRDRASRK